ncbi:MAG: lasso RiPP family leader peptide-containing protein [Pseudonocardiales bacterium]|nr:lasso RiPP family leader peptide-containing protein [Pseudonocardiales bacterium]
MDEPITVITDEPPAVIYEPPVLVKLGEFGEGTLGFGQYYLDNYVWCVMIWLAALFVPYGLALIINVNYRLGPSWILIIGYGVACAARSLQITHDLQQYRRELRRITSESR